MSFEALLADFPVLAIILYGLVSTILQIMQYRRTGKISSMQDKQIHGKDSAMSNVAQKDLEDLILYHENAAKELRQIQKKE